MKYIKTKVNFINERKQNHLNEGQFSWMTQDSNKQIGSERQNTIDVYMYDNEGNKWKETRYDGYGVFGGMDFYDLVATMNGYDADRQKGIDLAFGKLKTKDPKRKTLFPALVEDPRYNWKRHNFTEQPENDPDQSWYQEEESDEDYYESAVAEGMSWNDVAKVMDAGLKKAKVPLSYARDYVKSLERMAKRNSKKFFSDYGDFTEDDFIEDVEYNMANENKSVNEKLARGLKPLLKIGLTIDKKVGEDALLDLSDKFDRIDDEYAGTIASHLDMAIELMQDGYAADATKKLKQFNKACKDVLGGKEIGSAFESVNEAIRVNASGYIKAGKLGVNDQFLGRRSLGWTLSVDLGLKATDEYVGPWVAFDHVSMYSVGKKGGTILDDALTNKYTYKELKKAAADFLGIKESAIYEGRAAAKTLLDMVIKGDAKDVEGIKMSKDMAQGFADWLRYSTYGKKFGTLPFDKLFTAAFNWGLDRFVKGANTKVKDEFKELKAKAKEMRKAEMKGESLTEGKGDKAVSMAQKKLDKVMTDLKANLLKFKNANSDKEKETFKSEAGRLTKLRKDAHDNLEQAIQDAYADVELMVIENYDSDQRKEMASKGLALPDGSFPIKTLQDLKNAIQAYGRAKDQASAAKFIAKRAKALGAEDLIPDTEDFQKALKEASFGRIPKFGK